MKTLSFQHVNEVVSSFPALLTRTELLLIKRVIYKDCGWIF